MGACCTPTCVVPLTSLWYSRLQRKGPRIDILTAHVHSTPANPPRPHTHHKIVSYLIKAVAETKLVDFPRPQIGNIIYSPGRTWFAANCVCFPLVDGTSPLRGAITWIGRPVRAGKKSPTISSYSAIPFHPILISSPGRPYALLLFVSPARPCRAFRVSVYELQDENARFFFAQNSSWKLGGEPRYLGTENRQGGE